MRDLPAKRLLRTGHRVRQTRRVVGAIVDLLILQRSDSSKIKRRAEAALSLVLRETASLRADQRDWEDKLWQRQSWENRKEQEARVRRARAELDLELDAAPLPTLGREFDQISLQEARGLQERFDEELRSAGKFGSD